MAARSSGGHAAQGESPGGSSAKQTPTSKHMVHSPMTAATPAPATHHFSFLHHKTATPLPKPH